MSSPLLLLLLLSFFTQINAIIVDVPSGKVKCLSEDLRKGTLSYALYRVVDASSSHLTISSRVTDPHGDTLHQSNSVESGEYSFEVEITGKYATCFWVPKFELAGSVSVDVDWKLGIRSKGRNNLAKKGDLDLQAMEMELKKLEDHIKIIHEEMIFMREREVDSQRINEETASKLSYLSLLSLIICAGVTTLQLWHLKSFFYRKKIL